MPSIRCTSAADRAAGVLGVHPLHIDLGERAVDLAEVVWREFDTRPDQGNA
jgi:hypothetical protein